MDQGENSRCKYNLQSKVNKSVRISAQEQKKQGALNNNKGEGGFCHNQPDWDILELGMLWFDTRLAHLVVGNMKLPRHTER